MNRIFDAGVRVVIPAYNEASTISRVLDQFAGLPYHVIVVDDGSTDDTFLQARGYPVTVLRHILNLGQGAAIQTGIHYALRCPDTSAVVTFDADCQHCVEDILALLQPLDTGFEVVLGSRFLNHTPPTNLPRARARILKLAIGFTRLTTGLKLTDTHNGLRAFSVEAARGLKIYQNRMAHASEILAYISRNRLRYCEVPVTINYSDYSLRKGQSLWNSLNIFWELFRENLR